MFCTMPRQQGQQQSGRLLFHGIVTIHVAQQNDGRNDRCQNINCQNRQGNHRINHTSSLFLRNFAATWIFRGCHSIFCSSKHTAPSHLTVSSSFFRDIIILPHVSQKSASTNRPSAMLFHVGFAKCISFPRPPVDPLTALYIAFLHFCKTIRTSHI